MYINVPRGPEKIINRGKITLEDKKLQPMPDTISAHIVSITFDKNIGKRYENEDFFKKDLTVKRVICSCD